MRKLYFYIGASLVCLIISACAALSNNVLFIAIGIPAELLFGYLITKAFDRLNTNGHGLRLLWNSLVYSKEDIRLSFSYLFRIQIEGKYLLVRGKRLSGQYQPIGGVYKYYDEARPELEKFNFRPDIKMRNTDETDDLRITIKGKYLLAFMDWFLSMRNREYDPYREFKEELIDTNLLPAEDFRILKYRKVSTHNKGVQFSTYLDCKELLYSDIFEIKLTDKQVKAIKKAVLEHPEQLCLATDEELKTECYNGINKNLGNNAKWLIGE